MYTSIKYQYYCQLGPKVNKLHKPMNWLYDCHGLSNFRNGQFLNFKKKKNGLQQLLLLSKDCKINVNWTGKMRKFSLNERLCLFCKSNWQFNYFLEYSALLQIQNKFIDTKKIGCKQKTTDIRYKHNQSVLFTSRHQG